MKAAHEEILSSSEELQSTNEELETAKEELQSSNEELLTLNEELLHRNLDLSVLTNDLNNVLVGVDIPVVVLDGSHAHPPIYSHGGKASESDRNRRGPSVQRCRLGAGGVRLGRAVRRSDQPGSSDRARS